MFVVPPNYLTIAPGIIAGIAVHKHGSLVAILLKNLTRSRSRFFTLSAIGAWFNLIAILTVIVGLNHENLLLTSQFYTANYYIAATSTFLTSAVINALIVRRLKVFYCSQSIIFCSITCLCIIGFLMSSVMYVLLLHGRITKFKDADPLIVFIILESIAILIEAVCFVAGTFLFLYHIAKKIGVQKKDFVSQILFKHEGYSYLVFFGLNIYVAAGCIYLLATKTQTKFTSGLGAANVLNHTCALYLFTKSSFSTAKEIIDENKVTTDYSAGHFQNPGVGERIFVIETRGE